MIAFSKVEQISAKLMVRTPTTVEEVEAVFVEGVTTVEEVEAVFAEGVTTVGGEVEAIC